MQLFITHSKRYTNVMLGTVQRTPKIPVCAHKCFPKVPKMRQCQKQHSFWFAGVKEPLNFPAVSFCNEAAVSIAAQKELRESLDSYDNISKPLQFLLNVVSAGLQWKKVKNGIFFVYFCIFFAQKSQQIHDCVCCREEILALASQ